MIGGSHPPAMADLIERHHALLYRYAYRLCGSTVDAEDLTQQTCLIACKTLHQLRDANAARSWLCTILRHAYLRMRTRTRPWMPLDEETGASAPEESNYDEESLQQALATLTEEYRSAVILYYFQELSYQEIAQVLEIPLGTVMSRLSRGKAQLKACLELRELRLRSRRSAAPGTVSSVSNPQLMPAAVE